MSQVTSGMDIGAVRALASRMTSSAGEIRALMQALTSELSNTAWLGLDRNRFEGDWQSTHCQQLETVASALDNAAQTATQNAQQQEDAST